MTFRDEVSDKEMTEGSGEEQPNLEEDMTRLHDAYYAPSPVICADLTCRDCYEMKKAIGKGRKWHKERKGTEHCLGNITVDACFMTHQTVEQNTEVSYPLLNKVSCMLRLLEDHTMTPWFSQCQVMTMDKLRWLM